VKHEFEHALLASDRAHGKEPSPLSLETGFAASASRASDPLMVHLGTEHDPIGDEMGCCVPDTFQPKGVVKYRRGHGLGSLRIVRLASNNTDPAMSIFIFQLPGTRLPEDPHFRH